MTSRFWLGLIFLMGLGMISVSSVEARIIFSHPSSVKEVDSRLSKLPEKGKERAKATLYGQKGLLLYKEGKMNEAAGALETALTYRSSRAQKREFYRYLGKSYESSGHLDKAQEAYTNLILYDPRNWKWRRDLAYVFERRGLPYQAKENYLKALKLSPKNPEVYFAFGRFYRKEGHYHWAENELMLALEYGQDTNDVMRELSFVYQGSGQYAESAQALSEVISEKDPISEWGRLVYVSALAGHRDLIRKGMVHLYRSSVSEETIRFYEDLAALPERSAREILNGQFTSRTFIHLFDRFN